MKEKLQKSNQVFPNENILSQILQSNQETTNAIVQMGKNMEAVFKSIIESNNNLTKKLDEAEHYKDKYIALLEKENTFLSKTEPLITQKPLDEDTKELLEYAKNIQASKDTINLQDYAKLVNKKGLRVGYHQIYKLLRDKKILSSAKERYNLPYQEYLNKGWFQIQQWNLKIKGEKVLRYTAKLTPKGQIELLPILQSAYRNRDI